MVHTIFQSVVNVKNYQEFDLCISFVKKLTSLIREKASSASIVAMNLDRIGNANKPNRRAYWLAQYCRNVVNTFFHGKIVGMF